MSGESTNNKDTVEIVATVQHRRRWSVSEKIRMVEDTEIQEGVSIMGRIAVHHEREYAGWIKKTYFRRSGGRDWTFTGSTGETLYHASSTPIRRHIKVRSAAHPFDHKWTKYFRTRKESLKLKEDMENLSILPTGQAIRQVS